MAQCNWWRANQTIGIGPMRDVEVLEFAQDFAGVNDQLAQACVERAGGNPLFLEQLLRSADETTQEVIPGLLQSIIQSRADRLPARDRNALQAASVLGQRFSLEALQFVLSDLNFHPEVLVENHLVRPLGEVFLVAHALIRDGVYSSLLKSRRRDLHATTAEWFAERDGVLYAGHLEKAENPSASAAYRTAARVLINNNQQVPGIHHRDGPKVSHALTFKLDQSMGGDHLKPSLSNYRQFVR